jgi:hypothetical protein
MSDLHINQSREIIYFPAFQYFHSHLIYSSTPEIEITDSEMYTPVYQTARHHLIMFILIRHTYRI